MEGNSSSDHKPPESQQPLQTQTTDPTPPTTTARPAPRSTSSTGAAAAAAPTTAPFVAAPSLRKQLSGNLSSTGSASASPGPSRNVSPVRKDGARPQPLSQPLSTQPSAAAIQRALSAAAAIPSLPAAAATGASGDANTRLPRRSGDTTPQWPVSPRLKSPPPSSTGPNSRRPVTKKTDSSASAPSISVQSATPPNPPPAGNAKTEEGQKASQLQAPAKGPSRGPSGKSMLETVQENSTDDGKDGNALEAKIAVKAGEEESKAETTKREAEVQHVDSGSESAGKTDKKVERPTMLPQNSSQRPSNPSKLSTVKSRQPEGKQGMTVETETVPSIPQSAIATGDRTGTRSDAGGSLRLKPSIETIRPKKERKKTAQKPRSINQSSGTSKADIFEARVASAVDEANSSDSDETFVYESNPPDHQRRTRHHSRTPSAASLHSVAEQSRNGTRKFPDAHDDRRVAGKRSMKFSNNLYNDLDSPDSKDGSIRSHQPRHFGRFGRGGSQASMFDPDSPYTQASKLRPSQYNSLRRSRPNSPRSPANGQQRSSALLTRKQEFSYDMDVEGADDERTPLMGTVRTPRMHRGVRRIHIGDSSSPSELDEYYGVRQHSRCGRFGGCLLGFCLLALVVLSAVGFLLMSNRPLYDVKVHEIQNVLASEQELMLDLCIGAVNPNTLGVSITDINLDVFAKSRYVGTDKFWRDHGYPAPDKDNFTEILNPRPAPSTTSLALATTAGHGVDKGTSPSDDLERDAQTMLLGRIFHFDQSLSFDGSPLNRHAHHAIGSLRLERPGNKTETGGSERWERVLLHPFDLIVKGVLKYQLPVSQRTMSTGVQGSVRVDVDEGDVGKKGMVFVA